MGEPVRSAPGRADRWLVVMSKEPRAGAVKTRLARDIGAGQAVRFARNGVAALVRRLSQPRRWNTVIAVTPDQALESSVWGEATRLPQGKGDLGERMQRIFANMPPGPVVIVGTDIPGIAPHHIGQAFRSLGAHDAVFGPATDGGYWLVGLRRTLKTPPRIFERVRWSGPHALRDTLANMNGVRVAMIGVLEDVDDAPSHRRLANAGGRVVLPRADSKDSEPF